MEIINYLVGFNEIHSTIYGYLKEAKKTIFWSFFDLDPEFKFYNNQTLYEIFEELANNGVLIYITINERNRPVQFKHKNIHIKIVIGRGQFENRLQKYTFQTIYPISTKYIQHQRYLYIDNKFLFFCGTNISPEYSYKQTKYTWHETSLLLHLNNYIDVFLNNFHKNNKHTFPEPFCSNNEIFHDKICDAIMSSKRYVYFENQYFFSSIESKYKLKNRISDSIAKRITLAIQNNETFNLYLIINEEHHDENKLCRMMMKRVQLISIRNIYKKIPFNEETINKYLHIYYPSDKTVIHNKIYCFDGESLWISSANIADRSMLLERDIELSIQITNRDMIKQIESKTWLKTVQDHSIDHTIKSYYNKSCKLIRVVNAISSVIPFNVHILF